MFLQPAKEEPKIENSLSSRVNGQGKYNIKAVPPGTYRLFALGYKKLAAGGETDTYANATRTAEIIVIKPAARIDRDLETIQSGEDDAVTK